MKELTYEKLETEHYEVIFNSPIIFSYDENFNNSKINFLECEEFHICGIGNNLKECEKDLLDDFLMMWRGYVMENEEKLSLDAIKLKEKF